MRQPDFQALDIRGDESLRYGTRIDLTHNGRTIQLMSVHLKSGCFDNASTSSACETLLAQVPVLEGSIDAASEGSTPPIVLGDFIDHLVVDRRVLPWVDRTSFRQVTYRQADKAVWDQFSDHCPVLVELWIR